MSSLDHEALIRAQNFVDKTGAPAFFAADTRVLALVDANHYIKLLDGKTSIIHLTDGELLDTINREIALWNQNQKEKEPLEPIDSALNYATLDSTQRGTQEPQVTVEPVE